MEWRFLKVFLLLSIRVVGPESMFLGLPIFLRNRHSGHHAYFVLHLWR
jgi:hypothetical protein